MRGFALLAHVLAKQRAGANQNVALYATRTEVEASSPEHYPMHREYFKIVDRATALLREQCGDPDCFCARIRL